MLNNRIDIECLVLINLIIIKGDLNNKNNTNL